MKHPVESAVDKAVKSLPYGIVRATTHTTRGHVWAPQDAEFVGSEVEFTNGDSIVLTDHDPDGDLVGYKITGPEGEILDQGVTSGHGIFELIVDHQSTYA